MTSETPLTKHEEALCFLHVPKTGGLSLRSQLDRYFSPDRICWAEDVNEVAELDPVSLSRAQLVRGHFLHADLSLFGEQVDLSHMVTLVRDPIDLAVSLYFHNRRDPDAPSHALASQTDLDGFFQTQEGRDHVADFQSGSLISSLEPAWERIPRHDWPGVIGEHFDGFAAVGVTDLMDLSLFVIRTTFGLPRVPHEILHVNRASADARALERDRLGELLGDALVNDFALYEDARRRLVASANALARALNTGDTLSQRNLQTDFALMSGWHEIERAEPGAIWRWTERRFEIQLLKPATVQGLTLTLRPILPREEVDRTASSVVARVGSWSAPVQYHPTLEGAGTLTVALDERDEAASGLIEFLTMTPHRVVGDNYGPDSGAYSLPVAGVEVTL